MLPGVTGFGVVAVEVDAVSPIVAASAAIMTPARVRRSRGREGMSKTPGGGNHVPITTAVTPVTEVLMNYKVVVRPVRPECGIRLRHGICEVLRARGGPARAGRR